MKLIVRFNSELQKFSEYLRWQKLSEGHDAVLAPKKGREASAVEKQ